MIKKLFITYWIFTSLLCNWAVYKNVYTKVHEPIPVSVYVGMTGLVTVMAPFIFPGIAIELFEKKN